MPPSNQQAASWVLWRVGVLVVNVHICSRGEGSQGEQEWVAAVGCALPSSSQRQPAKARQLMGGPHMPEAAPAQPQRKTCPSSQARETSGSSSSLTCRDSPAGNSIQGVGSLNGKSPDSEVQYNPAVGRTPARAHCRFTVGGCRLLDLPQAVPQG